LDAEIEINKCEKETKVWKDKPNKRTKNNRWEKKTDFQIWKRFFEL